MKHCNSSNDILVLVDFQNDFVLPDGKLYVPEAETIIDNVVDLINNNDWRFILTTQDTHFDEIYKYSYESLLFPKHCIYKTKGWEIVTEVKEALKSKYCYHFYKTGYSIWKSMIALGDNKNSFEQVLQDLLILPNNSVIHLAGVAGDYCVKKADEGFTRLGYTTQLRANCIKYLNKK